MEDVPSWLRTFQRSHISSYNTASTPIFERLEFFDQCIHKDREMSRLRPTSRSSAYLNIGRTNTLSLQPADSPTFSNDLDRIWHNPNTDQLAETLKVVMMTRGALEPVPVQYNSYILHILEAYHNMRVELDNKVLETDQLKRQYSTVVQEMAEKTSGWEEKERNYRTEMKKLEIMLAGGQRGLELVSLARSNSALFREGRSIPETKSNNIRKQPEYSTFTTPSVEKMGIMTPEFAARNDARVSALFSSHAAEKLRNHITAVPPVRLPLVKELSCQAPRSRPPKPTFQTNNSEASEIGRRLTTIRHSQQDAHGPTDSPGESPQAHLHDKSSVSQETGIASSSSSNIIIHGNNKSSGEHGRSFSFVRGDDLQGIMAYQERQSKYQGKENPNMYKKQQKEIRQGRADNKNHVADVKFSQGFYQPDAAS